MALGDAGDFVRSGAAPRRLAAPEGGLVFRPLLAIAAGAMLALACGPGSKESAPSSPGTESAPAAEAAPGASGGAIPAAAQAEAEQIFASRCATCHGPEGGGNGPASSGLDPKPRNFQDPVWQKSVTDQHIETIIMYGGAAVGRSPAMPANPDLSSKPEVVAALRAHVRSLAR